MSPRAQQGFTLIELVMVIVVVALASAPILGQFTGVTISLLTNEEIQTAAQLAQERAEGPSSDLQCPRPLCTPVASPVMSRRPTGSTVLLLGPPSEPPR